MHTCDGWILKYTALCSIILLLGCSRAMQPLPKEKPLNHTTSPDMIIPPSLISIDVRIGKVTLQDSIAALLDQQLAEPIIIEDQDIVIKMERSDAVLCDMQDSTLLLQTPLRAFITKNTALGNLYANGSLRLFFNSDVQIDRQWNLSTKTEIINHEWIEKPKLRVGFANVPIKWATDIIIDRLSNTITENIDTSINQNINLPDKMVNVLAPLLHPYSIDSTMGGWLLPQYQAAHLAPITNELEHIQTQVSVPLTLLMSSEQPVTSDTISLPKFSWNDAADSTEVNLGIALSYAHLEKIGKQQTLGKTFEQDGKKVTITDLKVAGSTQGLDIEVSTTGSFKGKLRLSGKPRYSEGILSADDIMWSIDTKNIIHRTASWLGKGYIHDKIESMLTFDINQYMDQAKSTIQTQLEAIKQDRGADVQIIWGEISLNNIQTDATQLQAILNAHLSISITINDLRQLTDISEPN